MKLANILLYNVTHDLLSTVYMKGKVQCVRTVVVRQIEISTCVVCVCVFGLKWSDLRLRGDNSSFKAGHPGCDIDRLRLPNVFVRICIEEPI